MSTRNRGSKGTSSRYDVLFNPRWHRQYWQMTFGLGARRNGNAVLLIPRRTLGRGS